MKLRQLRWFVFNSLWVSDLKKMLDFDNQVQSIASEKNLWSLIPCQRAKLATNHGTERLEDTSVPKLSKGYCHFQLKVTFGKDSKIHKGCIKVSELTLIIPGSSSGLGQAMCYNAPWDQQYVMNSQATSPTLNPKESSMQGTERNAQQMK